MAFWTLLHDLLAFTALTFSIWSIHAALRHVLAVILHQEASCRSTALQRSIQNTFTKQAGTPST